MIRIDTGLFGKIPLGIIREMEFAIKKRQLAPGVKQAAIYIFIEFY